MSEPEIARRCTHCGVTLRQTALFCPQCGQELGDNRTTETALSEASTTEAPVRENLPSASAASHHAGSTGVATNVRERVEKIRHVSSVVIDQATYDPSLRFILVAGAIFILFLVLLILSKVIG
jgi:uncharacterized Zn finger protein (UPF0148 family)